MIWHQGEVNRKLFFSCKCLFSPTDAPPNLFPGEGPPIFFFNFLCPQIINGCPLICNGCAGKHNCVFVIVVTYCCVYCGLYCYTWPELIQNIVYSCNASSSRLHLGPSGLNQSSQPATQDVVIHRVAGGEYCGVPGSPCLSKNRSSVGTVFLILVYLCTD